MENIYNTQTGQKGYQMPGATPPAGWAWISGSAPVVPSSNPLAPVNANNTYGQPANSSAYNVASNVSLPAAESGASQFVSPTFINQIQQDPSLVAFYVNALAYGGYQVGDIINDIQRQSIAQGSDSAAAAARNLTIISPTQNRTTYQTTNPAGIQSVQQTQTTIPTAKIQGLTDSEAMHYTVSSTDNTGMFGNPTSSSTPDVFSQEFKNQIANTKSAYYDVVNAQLQASTEEQKAFADNQAAQFKTNLEKTYGITLSNDATQAFNQIQNLENSYGQRGISGSGMQADALDQQLRTTRLQDQRQRDAEATTQKYQNQSTLLASGTPQQIADSIAADKAAGLPQSQWAAGSLVPDAATVSKFSIANLTSSFPNSTPAEIQAMHDAVLDENGNLRSSIYATQYGQLSQNLQTQDQNTANNLIKSANQNTTTAMNTQDNKIDPSLSVQKPAGTSLGVPVSNPSTQNTSTNYTTPTQTQQPTQSYPSVSYQQALTAAKATNDPQVVKDLTNSYNSNPSSFAQPTQNTSYSQPAAATPAKTGYQGVSIVDYLGSTGASSDYNSRAALAAKNGITGYTGSASQNTQLLTKLRGY